MGNQVIDSDEVTDLNEARRHLEDSMPEVYRTLNNWSLEPNWERAARDWTSVLSEFLNREAAYRDLLERTVRELQDRVARLEAETARKQV